MATNMKAWTAIVFAATSLGVIAATPPNGARSSASASVNLVAQNRAVCDTAEPVDTRSFIWSWSNYLGQFSTEPCGICVIFR